MKTIFNPDFLLETETAKKLYHQFAADLPIIDYHNHLSPEQIAENKQFDNLTQIWLKGDHYKWRAMRALGVNEAYITGSKSDEEKFKAWATCVPKTLRNPLFHWTHLELIKPFGINQYLNESSASEIYQKANHLLHQPTFSTRGILEQFKVKMLCTTDDPCDSLIAHQMIKKENCSIDVQPGFRPDKALDIRHPNYKEYLQKLSVVSSIEIKDFESLIVALNNRIEYFHQNGGRVADHGLEQLPYYQPLKNSQIQEFNDFLANKNTSRFSSPEQFSANVLNALCKIYHQKGWVQQFHLGAIRNNNTKLFNSIGADIGADSIGDFSQARNLAHFLNQLDTTDQLAKTIIYNLNPADNEVFATMAGNFNDGSTKGKIQYGSAWWFLDQLDGMEKQINTLSNMGVLSTFLGMLTDSRSFLSFPRHDYFRRLICNLFGKEMEKGLLPNDKNWIGQIISDICYYNAKAYFNIK